MILSASDGFAQYVAAFNRGDHESYAAFYSPDVVLCNGAGTELHGRTAIVEFYERFRTLVHRVMEVKGFVMGHHCLAASLASRFNILAEQMEFADQNLHKGDQVDIESIALYELIDGKFSAIHATTMSRNIRRAGHAA
ncbi:MAG: nuclear transport factor 2 family protein [Sphingobium sp.]